MKELTIEEKIEEIKNTTSYQDVKNAWFPPYHEKEYYFVSYSHKDYKLVYEKLHRLQSGKKRINLWYDHNLTPGKDWEIEARRYIYDFNCKGVIFFLSENAVLSRSIDKEIEFVKESKKTYLSINLPCEKIEGHIGEYLSGQKMLELLKQQGYTIENYEEKSDVLKETFNDKITFLPLNEDIDSQITKILSLKRQPLLELHLDKSYLNTNTVDVRVVSINNLYAEAIEAEDFKYFFNDEKYVFETIIGACAFANCRWLKKVELPKNLIGVDDFSFFNCPNLPSVTLPDSVSFIGKRAFKDCTSLTCVNFGDNSELDSIGDSAFNGCTNLPSVTLPNSVKSIGVSTFDNCTSLTCVNFRDNSKLDSIGNYAFYRCESLNHVNFGDKSKLVSIGDSAFLLCTSLHNVTLPDSVSFIGKRAFKDCTSLTCVNFGDNNSSKLVSIGDSAFLLCTSLTCVNFRDNSKLDSIGERVFSGCKSLTNVTLSNSVSSIGACAFEDCTSLTCVNFRDNNKLDSIGEKVFSGCKSLPNVTLPDSVSSIGACAFEDCISLESITIPNSVNHIDALAFIGCINLKDVFYKGTKKQWKSIAIAIDSDC